MTPFFLTTLLASGLFAGFVHVVCGPDHLAAIAPYAVDAKAGAWRTGIRWGVGHSAGVMGVGLLALVLRGALSIDVVSAWSERFVGVMLCGIGIWGLRTAFADQAETHSDGYHPHGHKHPAFAVGTVHGLAGSSHLLGIVPALALPTTTEAAAYLLVFGLGTITAMATFSTFIGWFASRPSARSARVQCGLMSTFSMFAIIVGGVWFCQGI
ncbi:nickel transporter [Rhizobium grahamii]|uniref:High-affinity nickel transporter n=1 Tax=Rhizobium grahamii CCGE 502 TaxID=990285 RepID=S3HCK4_9HYPH|nr:nickel transporter [Rhizobium grahamii]EPE96384.1 High-affinity nickel transporter [Rhizobium grahamii CCGE 502]